MIKQVIVKLPLVRWAKESIKFRKEYTYDKKFFKQNYSHSAASKNKIGYNILLTVHSLEKGMANKNPRRFGATKIDELLRMIQEYTAYGDYESDFAFVNAVNILREYVRFYEGKEWTDAKEYYKAKGAISNYTSVKNLDVGNFKLYKKDFAKKYAIDYGKFISSRHSVREFANKRIEEKDLEKAINIAILSPSACNRQMCKVYYVSNDAKRKKLIEMAQGFGGFEKDTINTLVVTFDVNANYFIGERNQGWLNAGLFSMNLVNALHSLGIGSCFCQFGNTTRQEEEFKKLLGISDSERIAVIIACGYYADECLATRSPRKTIGEVYRNVK